MPGVVTALRQLDAEETKAAQKPTEEELLWGSDPQSPSLERLRSAKASMAELDLAERKLELVNVEAVRTALAHGITAMRSTGEILVRKFNNEAGEIFNDGVEAFAAAAKRAVDQFNGNNGAAPGTDDRSGTDRQRGVVHAGQADPHTQ
jgi:hypothetical protein